MFTKTMHLQFSDIHTVVVLTGLEVKSRDQDKTETRPRPSKNGLKTKSQVVAYYNTTSY